MCVLMEVYRTLVYELLEGLLVLGQAQVIEHLVPEPTTIDTEESQRHDKEWLPFPFPPSPDSFSFF